MNGEVKGSGSKKRISGAHKEEAFLDKADLPPDDILGNHDKIEQWSKQNPSDKDFVVMDKETKGDTTYYLYAKKKKNNQGAHTGEINGKNLHEKSTYNGDKISDEQFLKDSEEAAANSTTDPESGMWKGETSEGKKMEGHPHHDDNSKVGTGWYVDD